MIDSLILSGNHKQILENFIKNKDDINVSGSCFVICKNEYDDFSSIKNSFLSLINKISNMNFDYVNTIITHDQTNKNIDNIIYILWFAKCKEKMFFNKDAIREKPIWKDVEWGKREKNYNPKGKDPGNVWIPTEDDGKGKITNHLILSIDDIIKRITLMTTLNKNSKIKKIICPFLSLPTIIEISKNEMNSKKECEYEVNFGTSENMKNIGDNICSLIITSPPYWDLKNYFKKGQIGQESYNHYLKRINKVWKECNRILNSDGSLWININIRNKNNTLINIPYDIELQLKELGFFLKNVFIWHKSSGIPTNSNNIVDRHEYVLVFTKNKNKIIEPVNYFDYKNDNLNKSNIWNINRKAGSVGKKFIHPAIYPNELTNRIIKSFSNVADIVSDPFLGSGTTLISAINNNRSFVGYEFNEKFKKLIINRVALDCIKNPIIKFQ